MMDQQLDGLVLILSLPASTSVFSVSRSRRTLVSTSTWATSVRQVSSGYVNFVASGVLLTPCRLQHSSTLSCHPVSTTATRFSPGRRRLLQTNCNECWTLWRVLSATPGSLIVACHGLCIPSFIGWTFLNESTTTSTRKRYINLHLTLTLAKGTPETMAGIRELHRRYLN